MEFKDYINKDIIFMDFKPIKITEETRRYVIENPMKHMNCPVRIRMGKFYTDEEWEKRSKEVLSKRLPGDKRLIFKRKK